MNLNKFLKSLFGDKASRDMKLIQPFVEKVKAQTPKVEVLDNDALRARMESAGLTVLNALWIKEK